MGSKKIALLAVLLITSCTKREDFTKKLYFTMGTTLEVTLPASKVDFADSVFAIFHKLDSLFHPTRPTSDVVRINSNSGKWVRVARETADCLKKSLLVSSLTGGEFDITVGKMVELWHFEEEGHYRRPPQDTIKKYRGFVDYRLVRVQGDSVFIGKGQKITLSGIAKGYALDLVKNYLIHNNINSAIVNAGGDMLVLGRKNNHLWKVGIQKPWEDGIFMVLKVENRFIATSGNYVRYVKQGDTTYTHLFNPVSGMPLDYRKLSVTVIADSGYMSDALATAFSVMGKDSALKVANHLRVGLIGVYDEDTILNRFAKKYIDLQR